MDRPPPREPAGQTEDPLAVARGCLNSLLLEAGLALALWQLVPWVLHKWGY